MLQIPSSCQDLSPVRLKDALLFQEAIEEDRKAWNYYFPFIYINGFTGRAWIYLYEQVAGSILLYELRDRNVGLELSLVLPPFPQSDEALRHAEQRLRAFNGPRGWRIRWVQESDALMLARRNLAIVYKESEYIYDRAAVLAAEGPEYSGLRAKLSRARRAGAVTRPWTPEDQPACLAILDAWKERLHSMGIRADGYRCSAETIKIAKQFPAWLLCGRVIEVEDEVRAFAFGGPINRTYGCIFITIADNQFQGHAQLLRTDLMSEFPHLTYFNDQSDTKRPGVRDLKERFRPVEMNHMYEAHTE